MSTSEVNVDALTVSSRLTNLYEVLEKAKAAKDTRTVNDLSKEIQFYQSNDAPERMRARMREYAMRVFSEC